MKDNFSLSIPKPCSANWDEMTPVEQGKFCSKCNLKVVDFTEMTNNEIKEYFLSYANQKTCGRVQKAQLTNKPMPSRTFFSFFSLKIESALHYTYSKSSLLSVFALLTFLLGCRKPVSKSPTIMGDMEMQIMGKMNYQREQVDSLKTIPPPQKSTK